MTVARTRRTRTLQLGTALATTLLMGGLAAPAFGQTLPVVTGGDTGAGAGGATITTAGGLKTIDLGNANRVVNFDSYNVGSGGVVSYVTSAGGTGTTFDTTAQYAVLNRVAIGGGASTIAGSITGQSNIVVWLSNPNGIQIGRAHV